MPYGHRVGTNKIRTYPPIATVYIKFFFCGNMGVVFVRQSVHLKDYFFRATQFDHRVLLPPSLDVNPSRRHGFENPVKAFPARHCQKSPISPRHLGRRNTMVNIRLVATVPLTLHTDAQLPWCGNSLQTPVPLCRCRLAFRRACHGAHELVSLEARELFNSCLQNWLRHQVFRDHTRVNLLRGEPA